MYDKLEINKNKKLIVVIEENIKYQINYKRVPLFLTFFYVEFIKIMLKKRGANSTRHLNTHIVRFWDFCKEQNINSFDGFNPQITNYFIAYLNTSFTKIGKNAPLKQNTKRACYQAVYLFFEYSKFFYSDDFKSLNYFNGEPFDVGEILTESIPEPVLRDIKMNLLSYHDIYVRTYVLIALNYGMRYSEIIGLTDKCLIKNDLGKHKYDLYFKTSKGNRYRTIYSINNTIAKEIQKLIEYSKEVREEFNLDKIFAKISNQSKYCFVIYNNTVMNRKINTYLKDNNIKHPSGADFKITSHMFRRTIPEMYSKKGVSIYTAKEVLGHKSIATTQKYYDRTNEYEYEKSMGIAIEKISVFKNIEEIEISAVKENPEKFRIIEEGYCTNSDTVNSNKICPHLIGRGNCYGCPSMVTTPDYLPFFYNQLKIEKKNLDNVYDFGLDVARHYEWKIGIIKEIINKLEGLSDES